jgi:hypothetical protein
MEKTEQKACEWSNAHPASLAIAEPLVRFEKAGEPVSWGHAIATGRNILRNDTQNW